MAQLTWRNIDAPNIDTRGLAIANAGITSAFDRLAGVFTDRELALQKKATDDAAAGLLGIQDPEALKAAIAAAAAPGGDRRVNRREIAEVGNRAVDGLLQRSLTGEQLAAAQDPAKFGSAYVELANAQRSGNAAAIAAAEGKLVGARKTLEAANTGIGWRDTDVDNTRSDNIFDESKLENQRQAGFRNQQLALQRSAQAAENSHRAWQRNQENQMGAVPRFADGAAQKYAGLKPEDAQAAFVKSPEFRALPNPKAQAQALASFGLAQPAWAMPTELDAKGKPGQPFNFSTYRGQLGTERAQVTAERAQAESAFWQGRPGYNALRLAQTDKKLAGMSFADVTKIVDDNMGAYTPFAEASTRKILAGTPGRDGKPGLPELTPGEFAAGIQAYGGLSFLERNLSLGSGEQKLQEMADRIKEAKRAGGVAQLQQEANAALAPWSSYENALNALERKGGAAASVGGGAFGEEWKTLLNDARSSFEKKKSRKAEN